MKISARTLALLLASFIIVSGCGTKGPLYIPDQMYPQPTDTKK
jgi:predicted small lipoprotein YifL